MKRIMFNDRYGLTAAVLQGRKTMTRRIVPAQYVPMIEDGLQGAALIEAQSHGDAYREGEVLAVAQSYENVHDYYFDNDPNISHVFEILDYKQTPGWSNKLFVRADLMPHKIQITDINIERLQDISDTDCAKEGIRYYLEYSEERIARFYIDAIPNYHTGAMTTYDSAKESFAALIDKISGKGTWQSNPFVFAYSFKLIK